VCDTQSFLTDRLWLQGQSISVDRCSSEIMKLHKIVTVPKKIRFTGGMKGTLTVPRYHKKDTYRRCDKGFLAAGQAKEIFSIKRSEFDALPACGRKYYRSVHKQPQLLTRPLPTDGFVVVAGSDMEQKDTRSLSTCVTVPPRCSSGSAPSIRWWHRSRRLYSRRKTNWHGLRSS
jgi:hypothetical protein